MATFNEDVISRGGFGGGDGFGGGMGFILGALLSRGGLFGNNENLNNAHTNYVTNESLNQQTLGDIKASIPLAEAQVQLAMAGLQASLSQQATSDTQYLSKGQTANLMATTQSTAALARDIASVDTNVDRQSTAIQQAIFADGERTRQLITSNQIADLQQQLTVAQLRESDQRSVNREITNTNTSTIGMNQQQAQQQQQMQALQWQLNNLLGGLNQLQRTTQGNVIV